LTDIHAERKILLKSCRHIPEVSDLTAWLKSFEKNSKRHYFINEKTMTPNPKPKILWVDDTFAYELHDLMNYEDELKYSGGFEIVKIAHPDNALDILEKGEEDFACIILDIMMPYGKLSTSAEAEVGSKSGIVLARIIREENGKYGKYKHVPIILLTGVHDDKILAKYKRDFPCFTKADISPARFLAEIQSVIGIDLPVPKSSIERTDIFISYCHKDKAFLDELKVFLRPLERNGTIVYDDTKIRPGAEWKAEIKNALNKAKVALLLVSPDFLASDFVMREEVPSLLKAAENEGVYILWIPLSHCLVKATPIADYQAACDPARPLDTMKKTERNKVFTKICEDIYSVMKQESGIIPHPHFSDSDFSHSDTGRDHITPLLKVYFDESSGITEEEELLVLEYINLLYQQQGRAGLKIVEDQRHVFVESMEVVPCR